MKHHISNISRVVEVLSYLTKNQTFNNIDLYFTSSRTHINSASSRSLAKAVEKEKYTEMSSIRSRLDEILRSYREKLGTVQGSLLKRLTKPDSSKQLLRPLSLDILTDGDMSFDFPIISVVEPFISDLKRDNKADSFIGLQFITFRNSDKTIETLFNALESKVYRLALEMRKIFHGPDSLRTTGQHGNMADFTPFDGDVWKMLFGAFTNLYGDIAERVPDYIREQANY